MVGRSEDAEAVRREHVGLSARDNAALQNAHDTIVDHIMGGRPDLAVIRAREAVHRFPSARRIHAALAWALMEAGHVTANNTAPLSSPSTKARRQGERRCSRLPAIPEMPAKRPTTT